MNQIQQPYNNALSLLSPIDPPDTSVPEEQKIVEITIDLIQDILKEYPRIQSLDFSYNLLEKITSLELANETLIALNLQHNKIDFQL